MKHISRIKAFLAIILFLIPLAAFAESSELTVSMRIIEGGVERFTPSMVVREGEEASMSLSGEAESALTIGLVASGLENDEAHVRADIETAENQLSPELVVSKGEWASVAVGGLEFHILVDDHAVDE